MSDFRNKEGAFWFYWSLVVAGLLVCVTYRNDSVSLSAGVAATLIGVVMLLLPPLLRGGWLLWRFASMTGALVSLVALITSARQSKSADAITGLALAALLLLLVYILTSPALWDRWKKQGDNIGAKTRASAKGYLDHQVDREKAMATITRMLEEITKINTEETAEIKAGTARIPRIVQLPTIKQLADSQRSARFTDKITRKLAAKIPSFAKATETYSQAELYTAS